MSCRSILSIFRRATMVLVAVLMLSAPAADAVLLAQVPIDTNKPMVVFIYSKTCPVCPRVKPILADLEKQYGDRVNFVMLDVTDNNSKIEARRKGKQLGCGAFVAFCEDAFPTVGIFAPQHRVIKEIYGYHPREKYEEQINRAINGGR